MRTAEFVAAVAIALFSLYLMWKSGEGPSWDPDAVRFANIGINVNNEGPGSGFWPFWLSLAMLVSSVAIMVRCALRISPLARSRDVYLDSQGKKMFALVGGGLLLFLLLIEIVGFYGAMPVFLFAYIRFLGKHPWWLALAIAVGVPVFCFFFFDIAMRIVLPKQYLEPLFLPLYEIFL